MTIIAEAASEVLFVRATTIDRIVYCRCDFDGRKLVIEWPKRNANETNMNESFEFIELNHSVCLGRSHSPMFSVNNHIFRSDKIGRGNRRELLHWTAFFTWTHTKIFLNFRNSLDALFGSFTDNYFVKRNK